MNPLQIFYRNSVEREAVRTFLIETLKIMAANRALNKEDVSGIADAYEVINKSFDRLAELYDIIKEPIISNSR